MSAMAQGVRELVIEADFCGQRLDNHLFRLLRGVPKSRIYRMLRSGEVRVNGGRVKQDYRVQAGDRVRLPPVRVETKEGQADTVPETLQAAVQAAVLYEDQRLLVLNKPAGIPVHAGSGVRFGVIEALRAARPHERFLELAHRLDRETSGCLILARSREALATVQQLLREHGQIDKRYLALVLGSWQGGARTLSGSLLRVGAQGKVRQTVVAEEGKYAESAFRPLKYFDGATLMEVRICTGRTHQIRVQAAEAGHPLLGDDKYGDFAANRTWRKRGLKRLFLHAASLGIPWPGERSPLVFTAPLPDDLQGVLDRLEGHAQGI